MGPKPRHFFLYFSASRGTVCIATYRSRLPKVYWRDHKCKRGPKSVFVVFLHFVWRFGLEQKSCDCWQRIKRFLFDCSVDLGDGLFWSNDFRLIQLAVISEFKSRPAKTVCKNLRPGQPWVGSRIFFNETSQILDRYSAHLQTVATEKHGWR